MRYVILLFLLALALLVRFFTLSTQEIPLGMTTFEATLIDSPEFSKVQKFTLIHPSQTKLYLTINRFPEYMYGQKLIVTGVIEQRVLEDGRLLFVMSFPEVKLAEKQQPLFTLAGFIRERVRTAYQRALPPESASLLLGVVLGVKEGMSQEFSDNLSKTGLMHVVAASGMNVTLLAGVIFTTFGRLFKKRTALLLSMLLVLFYAVLSGLDASILRASVMASLSFAVLLVGKQIHVFITFLITAFLLLFLSPQLLFDIGFQLSCAATVGIIFVKPLLPWQEKKEKMGTLDVIKEDMTTSLATQITTLPILLVYFHSVGSLALLSNLLVLWMVAPLMVLGGLAAIISLIILPLASFIAFLTMPLTTFFVFTVEVLGKITPVVSVTVVTWPMIVGYYVMVLSFIVRRPYATQIHS